jgi:hypothetical protein
MTSSADRAAQAYTTESALALFDRSPVVPVGAMHGLWRGEGFHTGHPLDGLLEACDWLGKRFDSPEHVHPLVFRTPRGRIICVRPVGARLAVALLLRWPALGSPAACRMLRWLLPLLSTRRSQARLRVVEVRGRSTATIVYDSLPIHDALRQLGPGKVLGMMDFKGMARPLFFVLRR